MKKFLLSALLAVSTVASLWAVTDGVKYDRVNGIGIKNVWIQDRVHTPNEWGNQPYCNTNARTVPMPIPSYKVPIPSPRALFIK